MAAFHSFKSTLHEIEMLMLLRILKETNGKKPSHFETEASSSNRYLFFFLFCLYLYRYSIVNTCLTIKLKKNRIS